MPIKLRKEEARGGVVHLMRRTGFLLSQVILDLEPHNERGLDAVDPTICPRIRQILRDMQRGAGGRYVHFKWNPATAAFADVYRGWNELAGDHPKTVAERKARLAKLRKQRDGLFKSIQSPTQDQIVLDLDRQFFLGLWDAFGAIAADHGALFPRLSRHLVRERAKI